MRHGLGTALALAEPDRGVLRDLGEAIRRQGRLGQHAREQAHRSGELRTRRRDLPLHEAHARGEIHGCLQVAEILDHGTAAQAARTFHDQRRAERRNGLHSRQRHGGAVAPSEMQRLEDRIRHSQVAKFKPAGRRLPDDSLRLRRRYGGERMRAQHGHASEAGKQQPSHGGTSFDGCSVPVTIRPAPDMPCSIVMTCACDTASICAGQRARLS